MSFAEGWRFLLPKQTHTVEFTYCKLDLFWKLIYFSRLDVCNFTVWGRPFAGPAWLSLCAPLSEVYQDKVRKTETRLQPSWTPLGTASHKRGVEFHINAHCFWVGCPESSNRCDGQVPTDCRCITELSSYSSACIVSLPPSNEKVLFFLQIYSNTWWLLSNYSWTKCFSNSWQHFKYKFYNRNTWVCDYL